MNKISTINTIDNPNRSTQENSESIINDLQELVDNEIVVCYTTMKHTTQDVGTIGVRNHEEYPTQISIKGNLQYNGSSYRVMIDNQSYSYFNTDNVYAVLRECDKIAVVHLQ